MERRNLAPRWKQRLFRIGCSLTVVAIAASGRAAADGKPAPTEDPSAASLIEAVFLNEAWLDQARTFYQRTKLVQKLLDTEVVEADDSRRCKEMVIETTFAWDERRVLFARSIDGQ